MTFKNAGGDSTARRSTARRSDGMDDPRARVIRGHGPRETYGLRETASESESRILANPLQKKGQDGSATLSELGVSSPSARLQLAGL